MPCSCHKVPIAFLARVILTVSDRVVAADTPTTRDTVDTSDVADPMIQAPFIIAAIAALSVSAPAHAQLAPSSEDLAAAEIAAQGSARLIIQFRDDDGAPLDDPAPPRAGRERASGVARERNQVSRRRGAIERSLSGRGRGFRETFDAIPYGVVDADAATLEMLRRHPDVAGVFVDLPMAPAELTVDAATEDGPPAAEANSRDDIRARDVWALGANGQGQVVAVLDSGVDATHRMFTGKVVAEACYSTTVNGNHKTLCPNETDQQLGPGAGTFCPIIDGKPCSHGSHVAGIAVGNDPTSATDGQGVAPGANLISIQVFTQINDAAICTKAGATTQIQTCIRSYTSDQLAGLNYLLNLTQTFPIAAVNMSFGGDAQTGACDTNPLKGAIDALRRVGVASVIAAGNDGKVGQMSPPACITTSTSVGAVGVSVPTSFTNVSPLTDMMAPGSSIRSAAVGGGYATASGTSMAAPHISGAIAVLRSVKPAASVALIESALRTGPATTITNAEYTVPRLDLLAAYNGLANGVVVANEGTLIAGVIAPTGNGSGSVLRLYNPTSTPGRVSAVVRDGTAGTVLGTWDSPTIPGRGTAQFDISQILHAAPGAGATLTLGLSGTFAGYAQHLTWNAANGMAANVSGCDSAATSLLGEAPGLAVSTGTNLSSALIIFNGSTSAANATFDLYRAADGVSAGVWTSPSIAARASVRVPLATILSSAGITAAQTAEMFVARLRAGFTGYTQHAGVANGIDAANLSVMCAIRTQ